MPDTEETKLAKYIVDDLFSWFKEERNGQLEPTWRRNYDAFRGRYDSDALKRWKATEGRGWRSKVFVRLTKQKVVTGFNQVMSVMLQEGKIPWDIQPSPIPTNRSMAALDPNTAKERCDRMRLQIKGDFIHAKADRVFMSSGLENALYGLSWLRGPVLRPFNGMSVQFGVPGLDQLYYSPEILQRYGRHIMTPQKTYQPVVENPGVWNVFWDLENSDHNQGHGVIIRDMMSKGRFLDLAETNGYDAKAIQRIADQFTDRDDASDEDDDSFGPAHERFNKRKRVIPVYTFYGRVPRKYLIGYEGRAKTQIRGLSKKKDREVEIFCVVAKAKQAEIIRPPVINQFPYRPTYLAKWEHLPLEAGGVGIPENIEDSQMIINGLTRSMLDNKALSSNLLLYWNPRRLAPGQNKTLYPGKTFEVEEGTEDVRQAMQFYAPPDNTRGTPDMINLFREFADHESGISRNMEGQVDSKDRRTAYEMSKMAEAGNKMIGGTIRNTDEGHTEPVVTGHYHYHMVTNPDEMIKGDFMPEAKGYQTFIDRARRSQDVLSLLQVALSSEFTAQFTKVLPFLRELARTRDLDPDAYFPTDKELTEEAEGIAKLLPQPFMQGPPGAAINERTI
ncbi:MAG TPA: hypothetical protein VMW06_10820 [Desulfobacterales bacterium]|nr:hypothetical protein [Desulfobacterales bacterium]